MSYDHQAVNFWESSYFFNAVLSTRKGTLLISVLFVVKTSTVPVVAPVGTLAVMYVLDATNVAFFPLKVTLVVPARLFPKIVTVAPTLPEVGLVSPNSLGLECFSSMIAKEQCCSFQNSS
jgi:hypothetical protein